MIQSPKGKVLPSLPSRLLIAAASVASFAGCAGDRVGAVVPSQRPAGSCASLVGISIAGTSFTGAEEVPAGGIQTPTGATLSNLPAFCRVKATIRPTSESDIKVELWMPKAWNGKFLGTGNGGMAGTIDYEALANGVRRGYAVANTDLGTSGGIASMVGRVEKIVDFGNRATHLMTTVSKDVVQAFYAKAPSRSYFLGCSTGGGQGMHEAQRYPADYDGIVAGAPGASRVPAHVAYQWAYSATQQDATTWLTVEKRKLWADKVIAACDGLDGVTDGVIGRPDKCTIDPAAMQCAAGVDGPNCLSEGQVRALRKIYAGPTHRVTGEQIFPGYLRGTELSFTASEPTPTSGPTFPFPFQWVWGLNWDWRSFNFGTDVDAMRNMLNFAVDATNPNLAAFHARGGKLIVYQGLADGIQVPGAAVDYLKNVEAAMPGKTPEFFRLFNAPGMGHCRGGLGPNTFGNLRPGFPITPDDPARDVLAAMEQWVEKGRVPNEIIATRYAGDQPTGAVERTVPLCAWPKVSKYKGTGDANSAASYSCVEPD